MEGPGAMVAAGSKAPAPPASQSPYAFWLMTCELSAEEIAVVMPELKSAAARLVAHKANGGTEEVLQVVTFFVYDNAAVPSTAALGSGSLEASEDECPAISTSPVKARTGNMQLETALIFTGKGRVKSSVKRSVKSLLKADGDQAPSPFALQLTSTLRPVTARSCLSLLQKSTGVLPVWADSTFSDLGTYLVHRSSEENPSTFARGMQLGLDLLGPRKRTAQPTVQLPLKLLKGPSSSTQQDHQPAVSAEPPPSSASSASSDRLANLLAWDGELLPEMAKERAVQLMSFLHKTTEELSVAKLQLQFYKDRDALNAQRLRSAKLTVAMKKKDNEPADALMHELSANISLTKQLCASLQTAVSTRRNPNFQLIYLGAAALAQGEVFDITVFSGINQYHAVRTEGSCGPSSLSSVHIRCTDFEMMCAPPSSSTDRKADFERETRENFLLSLTYAASIHLAYEAEKNHERVTANSFACLQTTREDLRRLDEQQLDAEADIVTVIIDAVTDLRHFHFVKPNANPTSASISKDKYFRKVLETLDDGEAHVIEPVHVAALSSQLAVRTAKDSVPYAVVTDSLGKLAKQVAGAGKELHVILVGCNTIGAVAALHAATPPEVRKHVWVVCTTEVWPSDVAPFLWHHYGGLVQKGDLNEFRIATRRLLGEYTEHYKRQRIENDAIREARAGKQGGLEDSLANAVRCDRLDALSIPAGGVVQMAML